MTVQQQFRRRLFFLGFIWLIVIAASAHAQSSSKKVRIGVSETHVSYLLAEEVQFLIDLMRTNAKISRPVTVEQIADFSFVDKVRKDLGLTRRQVLAELKISNCKWQISDVELKHAV